MQAALVVLAAATKSKTTTSSYGFLLVVIAIFGVLYFLVIRPRNQRMRQQREQNQKSAVGDTIVTIGGLVGTIVAEEGDRVTIATGNGTELVYLRQAIGRRLDATPPPPDAATEQGFEGPTPGFDSPPADDASGESKEQPPT